MIVYVASKAANPAFALAPGNVIEVCSYGPNPEGDAKSYAREETKATGEETYVFRVTVPDPEVGYRQSVEAVRFDPSK